MQNKREDGNKDDLLQQTTRGISIIHIYPNSQRYLDEFRTTFHGIVITNDATGLLLKPVPNTHTKEKKEWLWLYPFIEQIGEYLTILSHPLYEIYSNKCHGCYNDELHIDMTVPSEPVIKKNKNEETNVVKG